MSPNMISPDDPRLTAYALDEMAPAERPEFEHLLQQDTAAQKTVEEIRAAGAMLAGVLESEPIEPAHPMPARAPYAKVSRFPYWAVSSLAAACFTMVFIYSQRSHLPPAEPKHYIEVPLTPADDKGDNSVVMALPVAPVTAETDERVVAGVAQDKVEAKTQFEFAKKERGRAARLQVIADRNEAFKQNAGAVAAPAPMTFADQSLVATSTAVPSAAPGMAEKFGATDATLVLSPFTIATGGSRPGARRVQDEEKRAGEVQAGPQFNTESYNLVRDNAYLRVAEQPVSTFAADVDTASYANVRRFLLQGRLPPPDAVRIEELVNYFPYNYAAPRATESRGSAVAKAMADKEGIPASADEAAPAFAAHLEVAGAPWAPTHRLVRIGLKGREVSDAARPPANLVFLLDVSGSMNEPNKLPLVKQSLRLLVEKLRPQDHVAIAVYAGASGLALPSTPASHKAEIMDAIERLEAQGSTNGAMGIQLAYDVAKANFIPGGVNRVILATDGDFNVGTTSPGDLVRLVGEKAKTGVFLTVLGFGMGNYKDGTLEQLADKGNGNYAYIDSLAEAKKTLVEQAGGTLMTIAKDVKLQVEFNPAMVQAYRLIGYENRLLAREDFNNDKVDAGEIGAGHTVTALYEVVPVGAEMPDVAPGVDALKYQRVATGATAPSPSKQRGEGSASPEMLTVKIRFKQPAGDVSSLLEFPLRDSGAAFASATGDFKFAAAVAAFGMVLRDSPHKGASTLDQVMAWAREGMGSDAGGYRSEFIALVEKAQAVVQ
ncbi:MAG: von Willebrand factor [Lacunisphaera sp.]|nr:von Willebrand factor [Lacunisphaera sp.]